VADDAEDSAVGSATDASTGPVSRERLYEMVWQEPMLRIGERFKVSSSYLARVCTELRVPRPPRGYWSKLEFGKAPERPELPAARPGDIAEWCPGDFIGTNEREAVRRANGAVAVTDAGTLPTPTLVVPRRSRPPRVVERCHPLLAGIKPHFAKTRNSDTGILRPFKRLLVDVLSSKDGLDAAIGAADGLFHALVARGHRVTIAPVGVRLRRAEVDLRETPRKNHYMQGAWSPERPTLVYIGEEPIGLTLFEMTQATEMQYIGNSTYVPVSSLSPTQRRRYEQSQYWTTTQDHASGRFRLQAYCPSWRVGWVQQWTESKPGQFATMVPDIVRELESAGPRLTVQLEAARLKAEEEQRRWEEEARLRREAEARALQEKRRQDARKDLIAAIAAWDESRAIADYFAAVERAAQARVGDEGQRLVDRIAQARELLGASDPLDALLRWKAPNERG
jgi:hypothetical protein